MSEKQLVIPVETESLTSTFPFDKVQDLAIVDAKEQITRWRLVEGSISLATILSEVAVYTHFGSNRIAEIFSHLGSHQTLLQFTSGIKEIFSNPALAWNSPETCVAWIGAIMLAGATGVGISELVIKNRNDTLGGHVDELETITHLLDQPDNNHPNTIDSLDRHLHELNQGVEHPKWRGILASCKKTIQKPKKTLIKWQKEIKVAEKWDKSWNDNTDKLLSESQDAYANLELATVIQSDEFASVDPAQATHNLANRILDSIGGDRIEPILNAITANYDTTNIEGVSTAIREWTGNTERTHTLKADLTYDQPYNVDRLGSVTKSLNQSISDSMSTIGQLEYEKTRVRSEYEMRIATVSNSDPAQKEQEINSLRSDQSSAISSIDSDIATQQNFITDTHNVLSSIEELILAATHKHSVDNSTELLSPYAHEEAIAEYYSSNS